MTRTLPDRCPLARVSPLLLGVVWCFVQAAAPAFTGYQPDPYLRPFDLPFIQPWGQG